MLCFSHQFRLPDGLNVFSKCYRPQDASAQANGVTLVLAHCSSGHKEQWEPVLARLSELYTQSINLPPESCIREAWALDAPNHGDSALLNKDALQKQDPFSIQEYGAMLSRSHLVEGHKLVAIGHSASTSAWTISCASTTPPLLYALILIEPVMVTPPILENDPRIKTGGSNTSAVMSRKEVWRDYDDLIAFLKKRFPWKIWDKRTLDVYLKYGFIEIEAKSGGEESHAEVLERP